MNRNEFFKLSFRFSAIIDRIIHLITTCSENEYQVVKFDSAANNKLIVMFHRLRCILMRKSAVPVMEGCLFAFEQYSITRANYSFFAT